MDELFREHPTFVPGSNWLPSSHVDEEAQEIARQDKVVRDGSVEYVERIS